jgi:hypothetical protein
MVRKIVRVSAPPPEAPHLRPILHASDKGYIQRMKPCPAASNGVCLVKGGIPGCRQSRNLGALDKARGGAPETNRFVQTSSSAKSPPFRSRRIRGCAAPEDWSGSERQEFVGGLWRFKSKSSQGTKGDRSLDPSWRGWKGGVWGGVLPGEWGAAHEVAAGEIPFPEKIRRIGHEVPLPILKGDNHGSGLSA